MPLAGRADLVRILREPEKDAFLARLAGYEPVARRDAVRPLSKRDLEPPAGESAEPAALETPPPQIDWAPLPFFYAATFEPFSDELEVAEARVEKGIFSDDELRQRQLVPGARPPKPPLLTPWPRLQRQVAGLLQESFQSRALDIDTLLRQLSRGRLPRALPFRHHQRWPRRLHVVVDRSRRLTPFWHDQDEVLRRLQRRLGDNNVFEFRYYDGLPEPLPEGRARRDRLAPGEQAPLLMLGDCGCLSHYPPLVAQWHRFGRRLHAAGNTPKVLLPAPPGRWLPRRLPAWQMASWERSHRAGAANRHPARLDQRAEYLLTLLSPAVRVEPGLLRTIRRLLPAAQADAGTEADVWSHRFVATGSSVALAISTDVLDDLRACFGALQPELRAKVLRAIRHWRASLPKEIWFEELLNLPPQDQRHFADELPAAHEEALRIVATLEGDGGPSGNVSLDRIVVWYQHFTARTRSNAELWRASTPLGAALHKGAAIAFRDQPLAPVAAGFDPRLIGEPGRERLWQVRQSGDALRISARHEGDTTGSPLALLPSTRDIVHYLPDAPDAEEEPAGFTVVLRLDARGGQPIEGKITRPDWASDWGRDQYGIWLTFCFGEVEQRMRYIPPGRFTMGSPKTEAGRFDNEIPHRVTLTRGFWLFDTAVTQALWTAVIGDNPSNFKHPQRPVERVSWDDSQQFIKKINKEMPGLDLRLPTEAEWEYACRAGTTTATYAGNLEIKGENNAPVLDAIAWYGGNSGVDFELENGYDSSGWKEKQHDHKRAGTHPVAQKLPNAWGLFDMLGNVWEWCADWYGDYSGEDEIDPAGPEKGALRVLRGGSWYYDARNVRAAYRIDWHPDVRFDDLGFRCARGQEAAGRAGPVK